MNIYAGNLLRNLSEDELRQVFESYGTVSTAAIIKDKISGDPADSASSRCPTRTRPRRPSPA
jgi:RNA recognition motif-containing protein